MAEIIAIPKKSKGHNLRGTPGASSPEATGKRTKASRKDRAASEEVKSFLKRCLVGGLEWLLFFHILGRIIPTDFHNFSEG